MGIPRVKLNYRPYMPCNPLPVAYAVPAAHVDAVEGGLTAKLWRNEVWKRQSRDGAARFTVKE